MFGNTWKTQEAKKYFGIFKMTDGHFDGIDSYIELFMINVILKI